MVNAPVLSMKQRSLLKVRTVKLRTQSLATRARNVDKGDRCSGALRVALSLCPQGQCRRSARRVQTGERRVEVGEYESTDRDEDYP